MVGVLGDVRAAERVRPLDTYATIAYEVAGLRQEDDEDDQGDVPSRELGAALEWAHAGVCVLQQSLPWPFTDVLLYGELDNRPAHRILYCYADLLRRRAPKAAAVWFTALVYLNPNNNLGARFIAPGGPQYPGFCAARKAVTLLMVASVVRVRSEQFVGVERPRADDVVSGRVDLVRPTG